MLVKIIRLRAEGRPLPPYRRAFGVVRGNLVLSDAKDPENERVVRLARVLDPRTRQPLAIPPLFDATLVKVSEDMWLSGYERHHEPLFDRTTDWAQTWLVTPISSLDSD